MLLSCEENEVFKIGSIEHLYSLLSLAEYRAETQRIPFKREDYKWILGVKVVHELMLNNALKIRAYDCHQEIFGIIVEIDHHNPDNIQLWENITDKL